MTPFEIPISMETFADTCPPGPDLLRVAHEGGDGACSALARTWISEGIPAAFEPCPAVYDSMRVWLANELHVHPKEIGLTGSARFGSSFVARKAGCPFGPCSDLDFFVVSEWLFDAYRTDFLAWRDDFRSGRVVPDTPKRQHHWKNNARQVPRNLSRGFIDVNRIPTLRSYETAQQTLDTMSRLVAKLGATPRSPSPKYASVRCYEDWRSLIDQMSLSLKRSGEKHSCI